MADATITAAETGEYELALAADTAKEVIVQFGRGRRKVTVVQNSGASPIYVGRNTLAAKAAGALAQVTSTRPATFYVAEGDSVFVVSAGVATVSIIKT